jgi:hypothetical protein
MHSVAVPEQREKSEQKSEKIKKTNSNKTKKSLLMRVHLTPACVTHNRRHHIHKIRIPIERTNSKENKKEKRNTH